MTQSLMELRKQRAHKETAMDENFDSDGRALPFRRAQSCPESRAAMLGFGIARHPWRNRGGIATDLADGFVIRDVEGLSIEQTAPGKLSFC